MGTSENCLPHQRDAGFIKPILTNWLGAFTQKSEEILFVLTRIFVKNDQ